LHEVERLAGILEVLHQGAQNHRNEFGAIDALSPHQAQEFLRVEQDFLRAEH
jgi:hypothetical protein